MTHFAIFSPPLKGHYGPYSTLAAELVSRGHRATFIHHEDARTLVETGEAEFASVGNGSAPLESWTRPMGKIRGVLGLGSTITQMAEFTTMLCREAPAVLRERNIDAIIADQLEPAGGLVAEHLGLPWISIATTVPMNREDKVPPPFVDWDWDPSSRGVRRNRAAWRISEWILRGFDRCIERNASALGLAERRNLEACFSPVLQISQLVPGIDFPRSDLPAGFTYTGPFARGSDGAFSLPPGPAKPTAYCTLGTLQGGRTALFRKIARACDDRGVRLVLTHGRRASERELVKLAGKPLVHDWLPQREVMRQVDFVVCHGGMVTVLDALSFGLPILVIPLAFEQPGIGARVRRSGAGLMLNRHASIGAISETLARLTTEAGFRVRAEALRDQIKAAGGVVRAADLIEHALSTTVRMEAAIQRQRRR